LRSINQEPFFEADAPDLLTAEQLRVVRDLNQKDYAVIDFPDPEIEAKIERIKNNLPRCDWQAWDNGRTHNLRIQDAWRFNANLRAIAANSNLMELLSAIYQKQALPFQTLNFSVEIQQLGAIPAPHAAAPLPVLEGARSPCI
jgi:hypothetical protein